MKHRELLESLLREVQGGADCPVSDLVQGSHLLAVESRRLGLASRVGRRGESGAGCGLGDLPLPGDSARTLASLLLDERPERACLGLAALNSLLPEPPEPCSRSIKAQELLLEHGRGRRVAVVGHFPFVERMGGEFESFWVLELEPRPGDLPACEVGRILPAADVVAITATTLSNGTLAGLLALVAPHAVKILLGPSTPFCAALFDAGLDVLAGAVVEDADAVKRGILAGCIFKQLQGG